MTQPEPVGGGSFDVDITRAPQAIRQLEDALAELKRIKRDAVVLGQIRPPTADAVSRDAAQKLREIAVGGQGSFLQALDQGIAELQRMIDTLRSGLAAYERADDVASVAFSRPP